MNASNQRPVRAVDENGNLACTRCGATKPTSEFNRDRLTPSGYNYNCRECHKQYVSESYQRHRPKHLARRAKQREQNRERLREQGRDYYQRNKEKFAARYNPQIGRANKAVQMAVQRGHFPSVKKMYCFRCLKAGQQYHHQSYLVSDRLCVVPVCRSCHYSLNELRPNGAHDLGILPTHYGLVRIAISTVNYSAAVESPGVKVGIKHPDLSTVELA